MFLRELDVRLEHIKGLGPSKMKPLSNLGIINVPALLCHYPRDWEDRDKNIPLKDFEKASVCTVVRVLGSTWFGYGAMKTLKVFIEDDSARATLVCFNRPFLEKQLHEGAAYRLFGHFYYKYGELQSTAFEFEPVQTGDITKASAAQSKNFGRILPVYPLCAGITQNFLRGLIQNALRQYAAPLEDELPRYIIEREGLLSKPEALRSLHFPESIERLNLAKKTLIYEELFYLEVMIVRRSIERKRSFAPIAPDKPEPPQLTPLQKRLIERLPFALTKGQISALYEINGDMESDFPMARLLQGDVGSGKTLVSFMAALKAVDGGAQAAIMAPTELLARQHAENAAILLEPLGLHAAFLTGNIKTSGRNQLLKALASGDIDIVLGTHALFSHNVNYKNLRLVVIDEQHRFGVTQRQAIVAKGTRCDLLMMSATPIPRTLALTVFGDMDVSVIRDLPPGRKPIETHLAKVSNEKKVYDFVRGELHGGRQAYFVYPLIEANNEGGLFTSLKDAESMAERLAKEVFPDFPLALIHSKVDEENKKQIMENFRKGEIKILVATSVVEVGVDVPNANCMVIEHAERFGLSALHQLRGRVGRGQAQSFCFLVFSDELTEDGKQRLKVMLENSDGFMIAEEDLKLRGPGQIVGTEQSGFLRLGIADPIRDSQTLELVRAAAFSILEKDPDLRLPENGVIAEVLRRAPPFSQVGL
jgi:ATP-dependent DNA helicase RecG